MVAPKLRFGDLFRWCFLGNAQLYLAPKSRSIRPPLFSLYRLIHPEQPSEAKRYCAAPSGGVRDQRR